MTERQPPERIHYTHRLSYTVRERMVGLFIIGGVLFLVFALALSRETHELFQEKIHYQTFMNDAHGLTTDTRVRISGVEVGQIDAIEVTGDNRIRARFWVLDRYRKLVRADSRASLGQLSIIGEARFTVSAGTPGEPLLEDGTTIPFEEPVSMDELMAQIAPAIDNINATLERTSALSRALDPEVFERVIERLDATTERVDRIVQRIDAGQGTVGRLVQGDDIGNEVQGLLSELRATVALVRSRVDQLGPALDRTDTASADVAAAAAELPELVRESRALVERVNRTVETASDSIEAVPALMDQTSRTLERADETLLGVQRTWPVSSSFEAQEEAGLRPVRPPNE